MELLVPQQKKGDSLFPERFPEKVEVGLALSVAKGGLLNMTWNHT